MSKSLLGAVAGAAIGFFVGGPTGAKIGWTLGSFLFAESGPDTQGPRLDSLTAESLDYGTPIPIVYGRHRIAGFRYWQRDIREQSHTESQGGKGGGGATNTTYSYYGTFAVGLCEGPILGIRKVWLDSTLYYSVDDNATMSELIASNDALDGVTVYTGTGSQAADSLIQATQGAANTPAYRHTASIVFDDLPLEDNRNRIPNVTCEVVTAGTTATGWMERDPDVGITDINDIAYGSGLLVAVCGSDTVSVSSDLGETWTSHTAGISSNDITCIAYHDGLFVAGTNDGVIATSTNGVNWTERGSPYSSGYPNGPRAIAYGNGCFVTVGYNGYADDIAMSEDGLIWTLTGKLTNAGPGYAVAYGNGLWVAAGVDGALKTSTDLLTWVSRDAGFSSSTDDVVAAHYTGDYWAVGGDNKNLSTSVDGSLWTNLTLSAALDPNVKIYSFSTNDSGETIASLGFDNQYLHTTDGVTWDVVSMGLASGTWLSAISVESAFCAIGNPSGDSIVAFLVSDRVAVSSVTLGDIVSDICQRSGLSASDIDVTDLTDNVNGYVITTNMSGRAAIEPLQKAFFFDGSEFGNKINFIKRGGASIKTIAQDDLGAADYGSEHYALRQTRMQDSELPSDVSIGYVSAVRDYEIATQRAQRINYSTPNSLAQELAIVMDDDKGLQVADITLYNAYVEREKFDFTLTNDHVDLNPTDVITVTHEGDLRVMRLTKLSYGDIIECKAVSDDPQAYTSTATAPVNSWLGQTVAIKGQTHVEYMDIPTLRNADNDSGLYFSVAGYYSSWTGAQIFKSLDSGVTYNAVDSLFTVGTIGNTITLLGDAPSTVWDRDSALTVTLRAGALSSATEDNVIRGENYLLVGSELIQFANATPNADGTYTIDTLLRGRRGTEWATDGHSIGERVVLLTTATLGRFDAVINTQRTYKAVTVGQYIDSATAIAVTNTGVSLKPFSPAYIRGSRDASNNIYITWMRRSRYIGPPLSSLPVYEGSEGYEVDVMLGGSVIRTITATSEAATYTAAQQTADGLTPGGPVRLNIHLMSEIVGRGYAGEGLLASGEWSPADISTAIWYDADDSGTITLSGSDVTQWDDKSGNNNHASQGSASLRPVFNSSTFNGKGGIEFSSSELDFANDTSLQISTGMVMFCVCKFDTWGASQETILAKGPHGTDLNYLFGKHPTGPAMKFTYNDGAWNDVTDSAGYSGGSDYHIFRWDVRKTDGEVDFYSDGDLKSTVSDALTYSSSTTTGGRIGGNTSSGERLSGTICEIILTADATDWALEIEGYLAHKWGATGSLPTDHPYKKEHP